MLHSTVRANSSHHYKHEVSKLVTGENNSIQVSVYLVVQLQLFRAIKATPLGPLVLSSRDPKDKSLYWRLAETWNMKTTMNEEEEDHADLCMTIILYD